MSRSLSITSACRLLACLLLSAAAVALLAADKVDKDAEEEINGPLLLPLNPPYTSRPIRLPKPDAVAKTVPQETQQAPQESSPDDDRKEAAAGDKTSRPPAQNEPPDEPAKDSTPPELPDPEPKPELSPAMATLRDRVRKTLAFHGRQMLSTRQNTPNELMHACLAFGCAAEVYRAAPSTRKKINAVTCLCWNYPAAGYEPLTICEGHIAARIGYGFQQRPSQLLAVLALSRVQPNYPIRVDQDVRTVADLVEYEKLSCRSGTDLSLKLIGLSNYVPDGSPWENDRGEKWSVSRIIKEELAQPVVGAANGGTDRLMGLSYAVYRRTKRKRPVDGQYRRAKTFVGEFQDYALKLQNTNGSWGPRFLAAKQAGGSPAALLRSTGRVLEWLAISLPQQRLEDPQVVKAVGYVNAMLDSSRYRRDVKSLSTREIGSVMHALHALSVYDRRLFKPADQQQKG